MYVPIIEEPMGLSHANVTWLIISITSVTSLILYMLYIVRCTAYYYPNPVTFTTIDDSVGARSVVVQFAIRPFFKIIEMSAKLFFGTVNTALDPTAGDADIEIWIENASVRTITIFQRREGLQRQIF